jgi:hypothetical protein
LVKKKKVIIWFKPIAEISWKKAPGLNLQDFFAKGLTQINQNASIAML